MDEMAETSLIGGRGRRLDASDKVTGRARYATDVTFPGMLFGKIVRSDRPHARIVRIDTSAADVFPGVEAIVFGRIGGPYGDIIKDQTPFAIDRVRYVGDPIAAIAADSPETAELAARLIDVEYDDLPAVFDPIDAMQPGAPLVHDDVNSYAGPKELIRYGNITAQIMLDRGNIDDAFARADHVVSSSYSAHSAHQMSMEPRAAVAEVDASGRLTIHASTQGPFTVRHQFHEALGLPYTDTRIIAATVGGGFGAKLEAMAELYAGILARATGRPVKVVNSREEDLSFGAPRHPMTFSIRSAVATDGTILGRDVQIVMDAGAYAGGSPLLAGVAALLAPGPYRIPNLKIETLAVLTNKMSFGAYRGPTGPQTVFAVESHTDAIAKQLGMDPFAFRLKNIFVAGDTGHSGQPLEGDGLREVLIQAAEAIKWGTEKPPSAPGKRRGKGLAITWWPTSTGSSACSVQMNEDGTVVVQTGATEIGTGAVTAGIAQIVAGEMGVAFEKVRIISGDTDATPMDPGAMGSRTMFNAGEAARRAAVDARNQLLSRAADILEVADADLEVNDGRITVKGVPDHGLDYADLTKTQMSTSEPVLGKGTFLAPATPYDETLLRGSLVSAFNEASFHCHAAEVEVDLETGATDIIDYVVAQDVGFAVTPLYVEGQMQGGAIQGMGYTLSEEIVIEDGRMLNPNLALYKIPTMLDVPNVRTIMVESKSEHGPYGAKGVGEPPVVVPPGAIANAVAHAIGTPVQTTPLTPERVLRAIHGSESQ